MAYSSKKPATPAERAIASTGIPARLDALLWQALGNGETPALADLVASAQGKPREHVVAETLIVQDANPLEVIHPKSFVTYVERTVGGVSAIKVDDERGDFVLSAWPTAHEGVFHLIASIPSTDPRWGKVDRWVGKARPHAVRCFLDHDDFIAIGTALSEHDEVEVQRVSGRKHEDRSTWNRSFRAYDDDHLRPDHREMVAEAESVGVSLRTLHMHVGDVMDVVVRRVAGATFNKGDFEVFENRVLSRLAHAAARRRDLFVDRERRLNEPPKRPIEVRLAAPLFTDPEATGEVIHMLERTSDVAFAVVHRNPYLHVVVTDNTDGSNYDLFVTSPSAIEIHPGFRASLGSLTRLSQDLGDYFEADNLRETPLAEPSSIFDLIG
ncbi:MULTISPECIES: hypothetical protein [unclassified Nocardioides]|uniref:hypothetical protein n=1 Tax=unclassified Nocardioides TaxID=2615069 RepID=UPI000057009B|nr:MULTISPECIES: hypothetical protein [unclassified Nocardioides]ABL80598.1 hypothetical protein Noca_1081 [Nocardioides sp. JS614]